MYLPLDEEQANMLRDLLRADLRALRIESARTDRREYREMLHRREALIEAVLDKLAPPSHPDLS